MRRRSIERTKLMIMPRVLVACALVALVAACSSEEADPAPIVEDNSQAITSSPDLVGYYESTTRLLCDDETFSLELTNAPDHGGLHYVMRTTNVGCEPPDDDAPGCCEASMLHAGGTDAKDDLDTDHGSYTVDSVKKTITFKSSTSTVARVQGFKLSGTSLRLSDPASPAASETFRKTRKL
jgi:hypothetical protein